MSLWRDLLSEIERDLLLWSQEIDGRRVLPNVVGVRLPDADAETLGPVLAAATAEVAEALLAWAQKEGHAWYRELGPFLAVELAETEARAIEVEFAREAPPQ